MYGAFLPAGRLYPANPLLHLPRHPLLLYISSIYPLFIFQLSLHIRHTSLYQRFRQIYLAALRAAQDLGVEIVPQIVKKCGFRHHLHLTPAANDFFLQRLFDPLISSASINRRILITLLPDSCGGCSHSRAYNRRPAAPRTLPSRSYAGSSDARSDVPSPSIIPRSSRSQCSMTCSISSIKI